MLSRQIFFFRCVHDVLGISTTLKDQPSQIFGAFEYSSLLKEDEFHRLADAIICDGTTRKIRGNTRNPVTYNHLDRDLQDFKLHELRPTCNNNSCLCLALKSGGCFLVVDCGKPLDEAAWDILNVSACFEYYADLAEALDARQKASVSLSMQTFKSHVLKEPIGVVGLITPWYLLLLFIDHLFGFCFLVVSQIALLRLINSRSSAS
ncbi:hypothetical protein HHK36_024640 [Tetracentron sinense]|uniref:Aldehyde dehydrogenase domain-containing protein n=1 Tax=Tetracentron sinense TaxID=13715 RepID=A0A835D4F5_TETSI|nr:hypothetical protein HHK36_024640 [Tetracentron sinense]